MELQIQQRTKELKASEREYLKLRTEVGKALLGQSQFSTNVLSQALQEIQEKIQTTKERISSLQAESFVAKDRNSVIAQQLNQLTWADLYELSGREVKKMVVSHLIQRAFVFRNYALCLEVNDPYFS